MRQENEKAAIDDERGEVAFKVPEESIDAPRLTRFRSVKEFLEMRNRAIEDTRTSLLILISPEKAVQS